MISAELHEQPFPYPAAEHSSPYAPVIDQLYREEVIEARRMKPEQKFLAGEELFHYACAITLEGIRSQNPGFDETACRRELRRRLDLRERMERSP